MEEAGTAGRTRSGKGGLVGEGPWTLPKLSGEWTAPHGQRVGMGRGVIQFAKRLVGSIPGESESCLRGVAPPPFSGSEKHQGEGSPGVPRAGALQRVGRQRKQGRQKSLLETLWTVTTHTTPLPRTPAPLPPLPTPPPPPPSLGANGWGWGQRREAKNQHHPVSFL